MSEKIAACLFRKKLSDQQTVGYFLAITTVAGFCRSLAGVRRSFCRFYSLLLEVLHLFITARRWG